MEAALIFLERTTIGLTAIGLQRRFDLEAPSLKQRLGYILGILVPASPLPQTGRPDILIRAELELLDDLLEGGHGGHYGADGLRLAPIRISTTLCHDLVSLKKKMHCLYVPKAWAGGSNCPIGTLEFHYRIFYPEINSKTLKTIEKTKIYRQK
jgi:hypothetical protein